MLRVATSRRDCAEVSALVGHSYLLEDKCLVDEIPAGIALLERLLLIFFLFGVDISNLVRPEVCETLCRESTLTSSD